jgi:hypothetical protein
MTREELKKELYVHYTRSTNLGINGTLVFYMATPKNTSGYTPEKVHVEKGLTEDQFYQKLSEIENLPNFVIFAGESHDRIVSSLEP